MIPENNKLPFDLSRFNIHEEFEFETAENNADAPFQGTVHS